MKCIFWGGAPWQQLAAIGSNIYGSISKIHRKCCQCCHELARSLLQGGEFYLKNEYLKWQQLAANGSKYAANGSKFAPNWQQMAAIGSKWQQNIMAAMTKFVENAANAAMNQ